MKNSNESIGNRTRDFPASSAVPQRTAPTRIDQNCGHVAGEELGFLLVWSTVTRGPEKMFVHISRLLHMTELALKKKDSLIT